MRDLQTAGEPSLIGSGEPQPTGSAAPPPPPQEAAQEALPSRRIAVLVTTALVVFAADLVTKTWVVHQYSDGHVTTLIPHVLEIELTRNAGAAFGIATGATFLFSAVAVAVITAIVRMTSRLRSMPWAVALGLLLGGAVGNLGDRIFRSPGVFRGHVVDWIYLHHWPVFNLADSGVVVGGILAALLATRGLRPDGTRELPGSRDSAPRDGDST